MIHCTTPKSVLDTVVQTEIHSQYPKSLQAKAQSCDITTYRNTNEVRGALQGLIGPSTHCELQNQGLN